MSVERCFPNAAEEMAEVRAVVEAEPQHQGVHEETDQALGGEVVAPSDRSAEAHVPLAGMASEDHLERCQQGHEEGHPLAAAEAAQPLDELPRQPDGYRGSQEGWHRGARPVGGQPRRGGAPASWLRQ